MRTSIYGEIWNFAIAAHGAPTVTARTCLLASWYSEESLLNARESLRLIRLQFYYQKTLNNRLG